MRILISFNYVIPDSIQTGLFMIIFQYYYNGESIQKRSEGALLSLIHDFNLIFLSNNLFTYSGTSQTTVLLRLSQTKLFNKYFLRIIL